MFDLIRGLPFAAKAVAAVVAPLILSGLAWLADNIMPFDVPTLDAVETLVTGVISGIATYFTRNRDAKAA